MQITSITEFLSEQGEMWSGTLSLGVGSDSGILNVA